TQTHYVAEYGVLAATNRLSQNAQGFMLQMTGTPDTGCQQGLYATYLPVFTCARLALADMQQLSGQTFLPPGALGNVNLEGDFIIEMSDLSPGHAHAGESQNAHSPTALKYMQVTFTATGQVRPVSLGPTATQPSAESASLETQRVHLTFGPLSP
ncbi:MAG TPA: hypothetical protein VHB21_10875, partial [Minicystis sp.]|nr:hypothetical protein [Minicystis sp.]